MLPVIIFTIALGALAYFVYLAPNKPKTDKKVISYSELDKSRVDKEPETQPQKSQNNQKQPSISTKKLLKNQKKLSSEDSGAGNWKHLTSKSLERFFLFFLLFLKFFLFFLVVIFAFLHFFVFE